MLRCMVTADPDRPGHKILENDQDLIMYVEEYCQRHMFRYVEAAPSTLPCLPLTLTLILTCTFACSGLYRRP